MEKNQKLQPMSSSLGNDKFLFGMIYINLLNLVGFEVEFGDSITFEVLSLGVVFASQEVDLNSSL